MLLNGIRNIPGYGGDGGPPGDNAGEDVNEATELEIQDRKMTEPAEAGFSPQYVHDINHDRDFVDILRETERVLHNAEDPQQIALYAMEMACKFYDATWCGLLTVDLEVGIWEPEIWYDVMKGAMQKTLFNEYEFSDHFDSWVYALKHGDPIIIEDIETVKETHPSEYEGYKRLEVKSVLGVPFWRNPTGFLVVKNPKRYAQRSELLQMLCFVAMMMLEDKRRITAASTMAKPAEIQDDHDVRLNLLGKIEIVTSKGIITEDKMSQNRTWPLLVYLVVMGGKAKTNDIIHTLWPDEPENRSKPNLRASLSRFRTGVAESVNEHVIAFYANHYALNTNEFNIMTDADEFENSVGLARDMPDSEEKINILKDAIRLYRGRFCESMDTDGWGLPVVQHYSALYVEAVNILFQTLAKNNDYRCIREYAALSLKHEPMNAVAWYWNIKSMKELNMDPRHEWGMAKATLEPDDFDGLCKQLGYVDGHDIK